MAQDNNKPRNNRPKRNKPRRRPPVRVGRRNVTRGPSGSSGSMTSSPVGDPYGSDLTTIAQSDANAAYKSQQAALDAAMSGATDQYGDDAARIQGIYQGVNQQLAPMASQYSAANNQIATDLTNQLSGFGGAFGLDNFAGQAYGSVGASALGLLANDRSNVATFQDSAQRQAGIEGLEANRKYLYDLQDRLDTLADQKAALVPDADEVLSRLDSLRSQRFDQDMDWKRFQAERSDARYGRRQDRRSRKQSSSIADLLAEQARLLAKRNKPPVKAGRKPSREDEPNGGKGKREVQAIVDKRIRDSERIASVGGKVGKVDGHTTRLTGFTPNPGVHVDRTAPDATAPEHDGSGSADYHRVISFVHEMKSKGYEPAEILRALRSAGITKAYAPSTGSVLIPAVVMTQFGGEVPSGTPWGDSWLAG